MGFPRVVGRQNEIGYRSIAVPGAVRGLSCALKRFGKMRSQQSLFHPSVSSAHTRLLISKKFIGFESACAPGNTVLAILVRDDQLPRRLLAAQRYSQ